MLYYERVSRALCAQKAGEHLLCYLVLLEDDADKAAFERLYLSHRYLLLRVAQRFFPTQHERAEDAVEDAFLAIAANLKKISSLSCQETVPYLVTIIKNKCRDILRHEKKYTKIRENEADASATDVPQTAELAENYRRAVQAIYALPDKYRCVLEARLILELDTQEIATKFGISTDLVAKRFARGRALVAEALEKEGICYE